MIFKHKIGKHNSSFCLPRLLFKPSLNFEFNINDGDYEFNYEDKYDWNKLYGFSIGFNHHFNSVRIGWRSLNKDMYEICLYVYKNGKLIKYEDKQFISTLYFNTKYIFELSVKNRNIIMKIYSNETKINNLHIIPYNIEMSKLIYTLNPYFGGNNSSPKNFEIEIKHI
jgi:hypothetical protein